MTMTMNSLVAAKTPTAPTLGIGPAAGAAKGAATSAAVPALPFAPLLTAADDAPAMTVPDDAANEVPVDVLDAALMQALDEMLNRGSSAAAMPDADAAADEESTADTPDDTPDDTRAVVPTPTLAMLMPASIPAVMPPTPAARALPLSSAASDGAGDSAPSSQAVSRSALSTDLAGLLAIPGSDAVAMPADVPAWQGLQRWSADLMTAMAPATSATATATGAALAGGGDATGSTLALPASREAWQQPLMQALGDRLQLQIAQRADSARLHLEPPQLGRIEIDIRQQGGALQVQLSASNDEVRQQLRQIAEPLRHELVQRHAGDVSVQVASGAQAAGDGRGRDGAASGGQSSSNGQQRDEQRQPGRALQEEDLGASGASGASGAASASSASAAFADALAGNVGNTRTSR